MMGCCITYAVEVWVINKNVQQRLQVISTKMEYWHICSSKTIGTTNVGRVPNKTILTITKVQML